ncbi:DUF1766-domain-containing protein [Aureobasidium melanogenum CBS 110374]|uniref:DUF1766-domain-containing protein n=1 Tax=Aureobasidium melanogenum (strain CBS 110374) TaxID=1043003 RepID=A0A074VWA7_AURM1|nr:DUF1766-domain-containing protein [Aureobasidium melanogenum CBS 110374]KEQ64733.1 DUF1766-domain-containing protein [Aureobasidium melanogenum CBS 110374]
MSFQDRTPESLVQRSDSKNPATTCRGITSGGKPCRRSLAASPKSSPKSPPAAARHTASRGVVAVLQDDDGNLDAAAFYCWQHKDQAQSFAQKHSTSPHAVNATLLPVQERTSIDSLVARLGVASIQDPPKPAKNPREDRRRPAQYHQQYSRPDARPSTRPQAYTRPKPRQGFWASLCCIGAADDDEDTVRPNVPSTSINKRRASSAPTSTIELLPFIPGHLPPQTASLLLTELAKPISPHDEAGYIYIFWLTETSSTPSNDTAASLLSTTVSSSRGQRRPSDVMSAYTASKGATRTIKLKIGRANNVHRRMNEWNRQCGYNLSLVRFYPYISSSSPSPSPSRGTTANNSNQQVHKVPHAHRVERLVHLELGDKRIKRDCKACGREHKEWFEIEATAEGVAAVDEVVRRWVRWAETNP